MKDGIYVTDDEQARLFVRWLLSNGVRKGRTNPLFGGLAIHVSAQVPVGKARLYERGELSSEMTFLVPS